MRLPVLTAEIDEGSTPLSLPAGTTALNRTDTADQGWAKTIDPISSLRNNGATEQVTSTAYCKVSSRVVFGRSLVFFQREVLSSRRVGAGCGIFPLKRQSQGHTHPQSSPGNSGATPRFLNPNDAPEAAASATATEGQDPGPLHDCERAGAFFKVQSFLTRPVRQYLIELAGDQGHQMTNKQGPWRDHRKPETHMRTSPVTLWTSMIPQEPRGVRPLQCGMSPGWCDRREWSDRG
jgi:hypothetical protein